jgi:hypothetical protein
MVHDPNNPFNDFEDDFKKADKADPASTPGRVPPETYKFILTAQELREGDGTMADHETFVANSGTKGFKLFCEIVEPESVPNPKTNEPHRTKGVVLEHVFWITQKNLPFVKRDIATILGREIESLGELVKITWAGRTFEGVVKDETRDGYTKSKIGFINPWAPKAEEGANKHGVATSSKDETKKVDNKADQKAAKGAAQAAGAKGKLDF